MAIRRFQVAWLIPTKFHEGWNTYSSNIIAVSVMWIASMLSLRAKRFMIIKLRRRHAEWCSYKVSWWFYRHPSNIKCSANSFRCCNFFILLFIYLFIYLLGWSGTESTITEGTYWPIVLTLDDRWWWLWSNHWDEWMNGRGNWSTRRKPAPLLHFTQLPHDSRRDWTRATVAETRQLTAWATTWPKMLYCWYYRGEGFTRCAAEMGPGGRINLQGSMMFSSDI
jgi:hypothetical protein